MGSKVSGLYRKIWDWGDYEEESSAVNGAENRINNLLNNYRGSIFVLKRVSSMFFNEDGDLAHEFYEEVRSKKKKRSKMKRVDCSLLRPEGKVDLPFPKIHPDLPIIMCEV
ncbi:tumor suppressor candidate 2-like [Dendronephthya gigantea]|uniref:tumor suppressor candidate 2-like n=1 Tax=Dendronephthya gigantea TaxID=151771 RepID=UPI00106C9A2B|nr:tumor suppressor candidate 2-like [Dendronephthya gigantea]XP_028415582.1 tumor suppressor candidate 2-like [Dendronephthya gigantea]